MPAYRLRCEEVREELSAYLDGEVPIWKRGLIRWHLMRCRDCAAEAFELRMVSKALRAWGDVAAPRGVVENVMRAVRLRRRKMEEERARLLTRFLRIAAPVAAAIIALLWITLLPAFYLSYERGKIRPLRDELVTVRVIQQSELERIAEGGPF